MSALTLKDRCIPAHYYSPPIDGPPVEQGWMAMQLYRELWLRGLLIPSSLSVATWV